TACDADNQMIHNLVSSLGGGRPAACAGLMFSLYDNTNRPVLTGECKIEPRKMHRKGEESAQFQVALFDPAQFPLDLTERPAQKGGQDKAEQHKPRPVPGGDGGLGPRGNIVQPAGVDADLAY